MSRRPGILTPLHRVQAGWALATTTNHMAPVILFVLAYERGGATLLAGASVALCVLGAATALGVGALVDRFNLTRVMQGLVAAGAACLVVSAAVAASQWSAVTAIAWGTVGVALLSTYRPLQASALPWLVHAPRELARANVGAAAIESVASLVGPALAAAALIVATPEQSLLVVAVCAVLTPLPLLGLRVTEEKATESGKAPLRHTVLAGLQALWRTAGGGGSTVLIAVQTFARGALQVLLVVLVLETFGSGDDVVGWLWAAMGVGGLVGAAVGSVLLRYSRLGRGFVAGVLLWGVGLVCVSLAASSPWVAAVGMLVAGLGNALEDASMFTFVARVAPREHVVRALSAIEVIAFTAMAIGSTAAPAFIDVMGERTATLWVGVALVVVAVAYFLPFRSADRSGGESAGRADLLAGVDIFQPLPVVVVEHLASQLEDHDHAPGDVVIREGEDGDSYHVIVSGRADVTVHGVHRPGLGPGQGFGEIALLREGPRTATVVAVDNLTTVSLGREDFLTALCGRSAVAEALAARRLEADP